MPTREVRMVPANWEHPKNAYGKYKPLLNFNQFAGDLKEFNNFAMNHGEKAAIADMGRRPRQDYYMPEWTGDEKTHYMMYEVTSEGTPISPACETPEQLAHYLHDNHETWFAGFELSYEEWLDDITRMVRK